MEEYKKFDQRHSDKMKRMKDVAPIVDGKILKEVNLVQFLNTIIHSGDIIAMEGDNQKQASALSKAMVQLNPRNINNLHIVIPSLQQDEHLDLFEFGIASNLDFSYAGSLSARLPKMIEKGSVKIGAIHTYLELYARMFTDLIPNVCLIAADEADRDGNLYTGNNTEDTPTIVEATTFKDGIVICQVNKIVDKVSRVDIPGEWVDYIVETEEPYFIEALFTRDPKKLRDEHVLMGMMAIKGVYAKHSVRRLNHGIGLNTVAIELLLPSYGEELGLKGKICTNWVINPLPTMIPAIECGWVESVEAFGSEVGMEDYVAEHPDVFALGKDGSLRSNRCISQLAGLYGIDMFVGSTLQMDQYGNSSTVTNGRITGFGGGPNMGSNPNGRRHSSEPWDSLRNDKDNPLSRGRKLIVQIVKTTSKRGPTFVKELDAVAVGKAAGLKETPVMIYGDDLTHLVTEIGVAYPYMAKTLEERKKIIAAVAGDTPVGREVTNEEIECLRKEGKVQFPEDLGIDTKAATTDRLVASDLQDIVEWSNGVYKIPKKFL